jgi:hypothetical protein
MVCPNCNTPFDRDTVFCGNCGQQVAPLRAPGPTVAEPIRSNIDSSYAPHNNMAQNEPTLLSPLPPGRTPPGDFSRWQGAAPTPPPSTPPQFQPPRPTNRHIGRNIFIVVVLVLLVGGATAGLIAFARNASNTTTANNKPTAKSTAAIASTTSATVSFSDTSHSHTPNGALKLVTSGLAAPAPDSQYYAWLVDTGAEKTLPLGVLTAQGNNFILNFSGKTNLLGAGNQLEITQEKGTPSLPNQHAVLAATFPPLAFIHIRHLLFKFGSTPNNVGLLVGLREQAHILNDQATLLKNLTNQGPQAVSCGAQNILNLIEGVHGHNVQPLNAACASFNVTNVGDGFGLFDPNDANNGYVILVGEHASLAATQSDSTDNIRLHAGHVQIAVDNLKKWLTSIDNDAHQLTTNPGNTALIQDIATLSDHVLNGFDQNDNGQIEPIAGEAGVATAYNEGQLMAQLPLTTNA